MVMRERRALQRHREWSSGFVVEVSVFRTLALACFHTRSVEEHLPASWWELISSGVSLTVVPDNQLLDFSSMQVRLFGVRDRV